MASTPNSPSLTTEQKIKTIAFLIVAILMLWYSCGGESEEETKAKLSPAEIRKEQIEKHFSGWDGSHIELTRIIKAGMHDPDSYEHVETKYWDMTDHLVVQTTFRGNNVFGGKVKNSIRAKVSLTGDVIEIVEDFK